LYNFSTLVGLKLYYHDSDGNNIENYLIGIKHNLSFNQAFFERFSRLEKYKNFIERNNEITVPLPLECCAILVKMPSVLRAFTISHLKLKNDAIFQLCNPDLTSSTREFLV